MEKLENIEENKLKEILKRSHPENFIIKVTVLECRELTLGTEDVPSPYIEIHVKDQIRETAVKRDSPDAIFNDAFNFQMTSTESELKTLKILIRVWHKTRWYKRDVEIGSVSIDAYTVYSKNTKMVNKVWAVLEKPGLPEAGHINYSILVIGENDRLLALRGDMDDDQPEQQEGDDENNKKKTYLRELVQGAPPIEKKNYLLQLNIYGGEFFHHIPGVNELNSKLKIIVSQGEITDSSEISNTWNPAWKEQHNIPMKSPFYITFIVIEVWYKNPSEKLLGRFILDFNQLVKDGQLETKWSIIYGPEREESFMKRLKYEYRVGSDIEPHYYYGRVLTSAKWVQDDNPTRSKSPSPDAQLPDTKKYLIWFDVYELSSKLISPSDKIIVELQVGNEVISNKKKAYYNENLSKFFWKSDEIRNTEKEVELPGDISQLPDIFIRVKKEVGFFRESMEDIAYCRFKPQELILNRNNVRPRWNKLRQVYTQIKGDSEHNYLGLLLCSINFFVVPKESQIYRPIVIETRNFKKYKLVSVIYMANDVPVVNKGKLPIPKIEITFNGKTKNAVSKINSNNPVFGEVMFISTYLNDCLDLSENIRMTLWDTNSFRPTQLGVTEIEVGKIQKYNSQQYIEREIYKHAIWYPFYVGTKKLSAKVLATFMIVKLTKQGKEPIDLKKEKYSVWPEQESYRLYIFIIGVRQVPTNLDLTGAFVLCKINQDELETLEEKIKSDAEKFEKRRDPNYENNLNVYDGIQDKGLKYKLHSISNKKEFVYPMSILVKSDKVFLNATVDLFRFIKDVSKDKKLNLQDEKADRKKNKKKKINNPNPIPEDFIPVYRREKMTEMEKTKENTLRYQKNVNSFPFEQEDANCFLGEEVTVNLYKVELDKKGNVKKEDDVVSNFNRPDIDYEYEEELGESGLDLETSPLQIPGESGADSNYGIMRYLLKVVKNDTDEERKADLKTLQDKEEEEFEKMKSIINKARNESGFICRLYILNTSNLHIDDNSVEEAFVWVKRYPEDKEWKDEKNPFSVNTGEVNQLYSLKVIYPDTFSITIEFHAMKKLVGVFEATEMIGSTTIDLEQRYFHRTYQMKINNIKLFKQIPIESRTLYYNKMVRGAVRMWVEILPRSKEFELPPERLATTTVERYEFRLIIWNTRDIPVVDGGKIDQYVKVSFNDGDKDVEQTTDSHCDSKDGNGKFNWRVVIPYRYPNNKTSVTVSVFDWNKLSSDDMLCSNVINIKKFLNRLHRTKSSVEFQRDWLPMKLSPISQSRNVSSTGGEVELEFKLLTYNEAQSNIVGRGRDEPNKDPFLETPKEGRSWMDKLSFIKDLISGFGGLWDGVFRWLKIFGIILSVAVFAYILSIFTK